MPKNMDQKRAHFALSKVNLCPSTEAKNIETKSSKLIAQVYTSGMLKAMDYACEKLQEPYNVLQQWFAEDQPDGPGLTEETRTQASQENLANYLSDIDNQNEYRRIQQEAIAFLGFLKSKASGRAADPAAAPPQVTEV